MSGTNKEELNKGRLWAALSYWSIWLMLLAYLAQGKNRFVRYHLKQSAALFLFKNVNALCLAFILKTFSNGFGNQGLILLDLFFLLSLTIVGTRNAWQGKLIPLPVFGEPFGEFMSKAWKWIRREAKSTQDAL